jgi:hypothetical protein
VRGTITSDHIQENLYFRLVSRIDPFVRGTDPDSDPGILPLSSKNSKKTLDLHCFVTSLRLFILSVKN